MSKEEEDALNMAYALAMSIAEELRITKGEGSDYIKARDLAESVREEYEAVKSLNKTL